VEKRYRAAQTVAEKIDSLQELMGTIPKHKGTDKLRADLRRRLSKLKASSQARKGVSKRDSAFSIDKEGAGQVIIIGPTNVGKSSLVVALTNATPEVSKSPYTTWKPTPGMMQIEDIQVQLIDTPSLDRGYVESELMDLIRRSDLIMVVVDLTTDPIKQLEDTVAFLEEHRISTLHRKSRHSAQQRMIFIPMIVLVNKNDDEKSDEDLEIFRELLEEEWLLISVSATSSRNFEQLKQAIYDNLDIIRVYSKMPGKDPDLDAPFVLPEGSTVEEFARRLHQDFFEKLKMARVWGSSSFDGQMVKRDYVLNDGDVIELKI
jgi:ribosome-interacting GTPase 1